MKERMKLVKEKWVLWRICEGCDLFDEFSVMYNEALFQTFLQPLFSAARYSCSYRRSFMIQACTV